MDDLVYLLVQQEGLQLVFEKDSVWSKLLLHSLIF